MSTLIIRHFGGLYIQQGQDEIALPNEFPRSLFCFLSQNPGRYFCRTYLGETLWPDLPPERGRRALSTALWRLRRCEALSETIEQPDRDRIAMRPRQRLWIDSVAFRHLVRRAQRAGMQTGRCLDRAIDLYRGTAFSDVSDDWVIGERARLENLFCDALFHAARYAFEAGDHRRVDRMARRLIEYEPYREDIRQLQVRAAIAAGNRAQAEFYYREFVGLLRSDLGELPGFRMDDLSQNLDAPDVEQRTKRAVPGELGRSISKVRHSLKQLDRDLDRLAVQG